jgi:hypothetical protein
MQVTFCEVVHRLYSGVLYLQNAVGFCSMHNECNLIYPSKRSLVFPVVIFMELTDGQCHYVQSSYAEFHPNGTLK